VVEQVQDVRFDVSNLRLVVSMIGRAAARPPDRREAISSSC